MSKFRKITAILLSAVMVVCMFSIPASAASAAKITNGTEVQVNIKKGASVSYKFTTSEKGDISFAFLIEGEFTEISLTNSKGKAVNFEHDETEFGSVSGHNTKTGTLVWDAPEQKHEPPIYKGTIYYHDAAADTYTLKIKSANGLDFDTKCTFTPTFQTDAKISSLVINMKKGTTLTLGTVIDGTTGETVKWSSSKKSVAAVTSKGVVSAKAKGTAVITAKLGKSSMKITVKVTA